MQRLGGYLIFFAIGSAVLSMTSYQFRILMWMDDMGNGAWVVRAVMIAAGIAMLAAGGVGQASPANPQAAAQHGQS